MNYYVIINVMKYKTEPVIRSRYGHGFVISRR